MTISKMSLLCNNLKLEANLYDNVGWIRKTLATLQLGLDILWKVFFWMSDDDDNEIKIKQLWRRIPLRFFCRNLLHPFVLLITFKASSYVWHVLRFYPLVSLFWIENKILFSATGLVKPNLNVNCLFIFI